MGLSSSTPAAADASLSDARTVEEVIDKVTRNMPVATEQSRVIKADVIRLLRNIYKRRMPVNVVFSSPVGVGLEEYCSTFAACTGGDYVNKIDENYSDNLKLIDSVRSQALRNMDAKNQAMLLHTADFLREAYLQLPKRGGSSSVNSPRQQPLYHPINIYSLSAMDHMNAMVQASAQLDLIDPATVQALVMLGSFVWKLSTSNYKPSETIFVYVRYSDHSHEQAFGAFVEQLPTGGGGGGSRIDSTGSSSMRSSAASASGISIDGSSSDITIPDEPVEANRADIQRLSKHVLMAKKHMDNFYSGHVMTESYITMIADCEDRVLLSPEHGAYICREVLSVIDELQQKGIWGSPDERRIGFLRQSAWAGARVRHVPLNINPCSRMSVKTQADQFARTPPFPVTLNNTRVAVLRRESGVPVRPEAHTKTSASASRKSAEPRPVHIDLGRSSAPPVLTGRSEEH